MLELSKWDLDIETNDKDEYTSLVRAVRRTHQRFKLLFVSCSPSQGEKIRGDLMSDISAKKYELLDIKESIDNLYEAISDIPNLSELDVLFIRGLEYSIFEYEDKEFGDISKRSQSKVYGGSWAGVPPVLAKLNMQRELFRDRFPHICFVFLLPHFAVDYFIRRAPDFYDWKSGIYRFETDVEDLHLRITKIFNNTDHTKYSELANEDKLSKIREIRSCLDEVKYLGIKWELLSHLSLLYATLNQYLPDLDIVQRAFQLKPNCYEDWYNSGLILYELHRYSESAYSFERASQFNINDSKSWYNRGRALSRSGRYEESINSFDRVIQLIPGYYKAWHKRGNTLCKLGRYQEAIDSFNHAIQLKPDNDEAWYNRGNILYKLGRYEESIDSFNRVIEINPADSEALRWHRYIVHSLGRQQKEIKEVRSENSLQNKLDLPSNMLRKIDLSTEHQFIGSISVELLFSSPIHRHLDSIAKRATQNTLINNREESKSVRVFQAISDSFGHETKINHDNCKICFDSQVILNRFVRSYHDQALADFEQENYCDALTSWQKTFELLQSENLDNACNLIQEFLDKQLLFKFQQPAARKILPQLLTLYTTTQVIPELCLALIRNLKVLQSLSISDYTATEWLKMWQELGTLHPEVVIVLRMLEAGIKYKQNPTDDRVFLSLPQEMRPLLREALGLEP
jgi:tetratricopeptide (TPR) repeat protein